MAELAELAAAPRENFPILGKRYSVTLTARYVNDDAVLKGAHNADRVLVENATMPKLPIDAPAPSENVAFIIESSCMIVTKG